MQSHFTENEAFYLSTVAFKSPTWPVRSLSDKCSKTDVTTVNEVMSIQDYERKRKEDAGQNGLRNT